MIDFFFWTTDNGYKARMGIEESGLPYRLNIINIRNKDQFAPEFLKISPGHKIPAIIDHDGPGGQRTSLCESGAILKYVSEKSGNGLYPTNSIARIKCDQWLFYGSATFTTLAQQFGHWVKRNPEIVPAAQKHYTEVLKDMLVTLNGHLADHEYLADAYSVADISVYADVHLHGLNDVGLGDYRHIRRWHDTIEARDAVQRAWGPHE